MVLNRVFSGKARVVSALLSSVVMIGIVAAAQALPSADNKNEAADTVLLSGKIATVDSSDTMVQALAIKAGKIIAVGSNKTIAALANKNTQVIQLNGRRVTPGLVDAHNHLASAAAGADHSLDLSYPGVKSIRDVTDRVSAAVASSDKGEWITGFLWDDAKLTEKRMITAKDLDAVAPDQPVWLFHVSSHYAVANSKAMAIKGVNKNTPDPVGGEIQRYADGSPTGIFKDTAVDLIGYWTELQSVEQLQQGIKTYLPLLHKEGVTAVKDPEINATIWRAYQNSLAEGDLTARVFTLWRAGQSLADVDALIKQIAPFTHPQVSTDDRLISGGVKLYADGSGTARTAWLYEEWNKNFNEVDSGNFGLPRVEPELLQQKIKRVHDAGLHMGVHAIGDRAIDVSVNGFAKAAKANPIKGLRHSIVHANIPSDHAISLMARLQRDYDMAYPEVQPGFIWWIGDGYAANFGAERSLRYMPLKTFLQQGVQWAGSTDYDVTPFAVRYGLWSSVARETQFKSYGDAYGRAETVNIATALRSFTLWGAHQLFLDDKIGSLEVGKYADLVVWNKDMFTVPPAELTTLQSELTMVGGKVVYRSAVSE